MRSASRSSVLALAALLAACGGGGGGTTTRVSGTAHLLNGATDADPDAPALRARPRALLDDVAPSDGVWKITPSQMTVTVTGIGFGNTARETEENRVSLSGCSATFDLTKAALTSLADCAISAPAGTWTTMTLFYGNDYTMVVDDDGKFYSDASSKTGVVMARPTGGATAIAIRDTNSLGQDENQLTLTLAAPVTFAADAPPDVYVVFNPIHWMQVKVSGGQVVDPADDKSTSAKNAVRMSGNPPIIASTSGFGKAQYYTTVGTLGAYQPSGGCGFIILYADASTPVLATQVDGSNVATYLNLGLTGYADPAVSFNGDTSEWGRFGYLGLHDGTLAWAPAYYDTSVGNEIEGYRGMVEMAALDTVGDTTTLSWWSTSAPPTPTSGTNYSGGYTWSGSTTGCTGAAGSCSGSYTMTLLVN